MVVLSMLIEFLKPMKPCCRERHLRLAPRQALPCRKGSETRKGTAEIRCLAHDKGDIKGDISRKQIATFTNYISELD